MAHHGYDLQLTRYDDRGWRATFYTTGMEHSPASATRTGWHSTQRVAREVPPSSRPEPGLLPQDTRNVKRKCANL
jgi:hypothetical protein